MTIDKPHILLVEDEPSIRKPLARYLKENGFRVTQTENAASARAQLLVHAIDLVVLDIMMPGEDGLSLCRHIRANSEVPVILLTARNEDTERIVGLEMGADDYVSKPFNPRELIARIRVVLRRTGGGAVRQRAPEIQNYGFGSWVLRSGERTLIDGDGIAVPLSTGEFNLLLALVTHPNQVLSRDHLLDLTQGREAQAFDRAVDNQISRLRRKIEADPKSPVFIKTVWGEGYVLASDVVLL